MAGAVCRDKNLPNKRTDQSKFSRAIHVRHRKKKKKKPTVAPTVKAQLKTQNIQNMRFDKSRRLYRILVRFISHIILHSTYKMQRKPTTGRKEIRLTLLEPICAKGSTQHLLRQTYRYITTSNQGM